MRLRRVVFNAYEEIMTVERQINTYVRNFFSRSRYSYLQTSTLKRFLFSVLYYRG